MLPSFLSRLLGKRPAKEEPRQLVAKSAASLQQLNCELLQALGRYDPGQPPVVFSPLQTRNRWSRGTLMHEETHQALTINTTYGALYQALAILARRGRLRDLCSLCLEAQWGAQEGAATYVQMSYIARDDPGSLDEAIGFLPSEELGQPSYREWFDRLNGLLPVEPVSTQEDLLRVSDHADFIFGLALYALNADVFSTFPSPAHLTAHAFESFLAREGPDTRLVKTISSVARRDRRDSLYGEFRSLCEAGRAGQVPAGSSMDWLMGRIASLQPDHTFVDNATRRQRSEAFFQAWVPSARLQRTEPADVGFVEELPTASVRYLPDWSERFTDIFPDETLTLERFRAQVAAVQSEGMGLACSIAMFREDELHLATMPYPRGSDIDPSSWDDILKLLENVPTQAAILGADAVVAVLEEFPDAPLSVSFLRSSWRVWDPLVSRRILLRRSVQICLEHELSETGLRELLEFRDVGKDSEYLAFRVHGEQYAAWFFDRNRPGIHALQGVAGGAGMQIFERLAHRLRLRQFEDRPDDLPHANLIRLAGQGFLM